ncbi:MAG: peptidylprolyl isomerase, partial [Candidatus Puniceispirillaceae bacterium]
MAVCVIASFAFFSQPGMAQQRVSVVALVNGEPITNLDLENRMAFLRLLSNLQMSEEDFKTDTLQKLIAEKIKFQAAKKQFGAYLQEASQQARQLIDDSFKRGDKSGTQVLKEGGITLSTVTDKYIADILWSSVLRSRFPRQFENLDNLAQLELEKLKAAQNEPQVKLSEILLQPTPNRPIEKTSELANKIIEALGQNANFSVIASQYSEAATASQGGRVNWMRVSQLPPVLRSSLAEADEGDIIGPLVLDGRIYILKKDGYRENGLADPKAAKLTLARAVMPLTSEASNEERMAAGQKLMAQADAINNCEEMAALNTELG